MVIEITHPFLFETPKGGAAVRGAHSIVVIQICKADLEELPHSRAGANVGYLEILRTFAGRAELPSSCEL
jgi:hypothetical protein